MSPKDERAEQARRNERTTVFGWLGVGLLVLAGAAVAFLGVWTVEAVAPVERHHAVIMRVDDDPGDLSDGHERFDYRLEAMTTDGRVVALAGGQERVDHLSYGEPVIVTLSRATGRPLSVRHGDGEVELHHHPWAVLAVVLAGLFAAVVAWRARPLLRAASAVLPFAPRLVTATLAAAALVLAGHALLDRETHGDSRNVADGMGIYRDEKVFPKRVVPTGREARLDDLFVTARGPAADVVPATGDATRLRIVAVPFAGRNPTAADIPWVPVKLIGEGPGEAQLLRASRCGGEPGASDGSFARGETTGRLCFAVAQRFEPRYLILTRGGTTLALDVRAGGDAAR
ncbi:hypothetical protein [Streptomyces sp. NRRL F-5727]|uniref:hypothetical protein n=1 Tax=Streptomyces sp. NRRL F-5727 TaxID=1463871 RepID=UPI0004C97980|nr:hypothetical protein [Streptomyces sp. NRRL F-5727]